MARLHWRLYSPATTRSQLTGDPRFGALAGVSFAQVLDFVASECHQALEPV
jgi:hypothetical protein